MRCFIFFSMLFFSIYLHAQTITIGDQIWMDKNLESSNFQDGAAILHAQSAEAWQQATENGQPAWCWYYDEATGKQYGYLYNIHAITKGNPCPKGFRVPTKEDWETLFTYVGNDSGALKSTGGWETYNGKGNGTNSSGFNVLPGGVRSGYGGFNEYKKAAYFWVSTPYPDTNHGLYSIQIVWHANTLKFAPSGIKGGLNCRCIKE